MLRSLLWYGFWLMAALASGLVLSLGGIFLYLNPQVPKAETYRNVSLETPLRIYTSDGALVAEFGERRVIPIAIEEVPETFIRALLDTEDKRFYEHGGIDYLSLANDTLALLWSRDVSSGGASTITMQLARNISFSLEQTFIRKFKEMLLSLKLERELSKDEILELYINAVPFGKRAYGAQAAAFTYYNKPLGELTLAQQAMLAGIPQAPSAGNPINGPQRALGRRNLVLTRMLEQGSITGAEHQQASAELISARVYQRTLEAPAPFAAEWVRSQLLPDFEDLYSGGYSVYTTLRAEPQRAATTALRQGLMDYDRKHGYRGPEQSIDDPSTYAEVLSQARPYADLQPAVVTGLGDAAIDVLLADGSTAQVEFETMTWARRYLNVNERGPVPKAPADVVAVGDLIRVRSVPMTSDDESAAADTSNEGTEEGKQDDGASPVAWHFAQLPEAQGALIALEADDGAVRALEGGFDFSLNQFNHALQATRQPGSGFKPFVYSAALERGITPASVFMDAPLVFDDNELETEYRPDNDNNRYNGPTRLREALYRSINLVSMRVLLKVGAGTVIDHAKRFAFPISTFPRDTQLALGGGTMTVTPLQMVSAYAVFANGGFEVEPYIIDRVENLNGDVVRSTNPLVVCRDCPEVETTAGATPAAGEEPTLVTLVPDAGEAVRESTGIEATDPGFAVGEATEDGATEPAMEAPRYAQRVLDERNSYLMNTMLRDVVRRGTGRRALALERPDVGGKTGTTNDGTDTWFNGFSGGLVTSVWVGFSDYEPLGARAYGGNTALPIWVGFNRTALGDRPTQELMQPPGIAVVKIDPETGDAARPGQAGSIFEYFFAETAPEPPPVVDDEPVLTDDSDFQAVDIF
ncbi:MAG: transglycosylase domain-containing protein [Pseudomonadota bacterium]